MAPIQTLTDPVAIAAALTAAGIQIVSPKTLEPVTMSGDQIAEPSATLNARRETFLVLSRRIENAAVTLDQKI